MKFEEHRSAGAVEIFLAVIASGPQRAGTRGTDLWQRGWITHPPKVVTEATYAMESYLDLLGNFLASSSPVRPGGCAPQCPHNEHGLEEEPHEP